jgi:DNA-binding protein HU-beta
MANRLNKKDLVGMIAEKTEMSKKNVEQFINSFVEVTTEQLQKGNEVVLIGFMTMSVNQRKARKGRNPQTGAEINIPAKKYVKINPGKVLNDSVA